MSFFDDVQQIATTVSTANQNIGETLLNTITDQNKFINDLTTKYIFKPLGAQGIGGFVFDVVREDKVELKSDITDHWIEDNTTIQDHIANSPELITITGFISELYYAPNGKVNQTESIAKSLFAEAVVEKLQDIAALVPPFNNSVLSKAQQSANQNSAATVITQKTANRLQNLVEIGLRSTIADTRQQQAYMILESLRRTKQLITVETPFEYFPTCAIQQVVAIQPEDSKYQSEFTVTLKKMNFANVTFTDISNTQLQGRNADMKAAVTNQGKTTGTSATSGDSALSQILDFGIKTFNN